ncbi:MULTISPECIES: hypothetical protein [Erysipelotrichaceae]|uniref:hypothetical protein n=1 Tax=Erysipelotrichaceae TaxID=128827 RepID=UPI001314D49F|nr:hypothetical protein [Absiella sp. AM27-20]
MIEYAVYDKDDNLQIVGDSKACAKFLGITLGSFRSRVCRNKSGKWNGKKKGIVVRI